MPKHALVFVHGMGDFADGWHKDAWDVLTSAFAHYDAFKGRAVLSDLVEPVPTIYSTLLVNLREQWKSDAKSFKDTLVNQMDRADVSESANVQKQVDTVANYAGAGKDSFIWTHAMDVVLYRFESTIRQATNVSLARQILDRATTMDFSGWSIVAHSMGTAVAHNTLQALYTTPLVDGKPPLKTVETRPKVLAMIANVSRVLQLPALKVFSSNVCPGSPLLDRACDTYLNVRHQWDPFTVPQPFLPDPSWPDPVTFNSSQYQHIRPSHLVLKQYKEVHDLDFYLKNPRVHVPIFRGIFGQDVIPDAELTAACQQFDSAILEDNTNDVRNALDQIQPSASDSWPQLIQVLFKLYGMGGVP